MLESWLGGQEQMFVFWGQVLCLVPGLPGEYLRRCYYYLTLQAGSLTCSIGFLSRFSHRQVRIGARVYIGNGTTIGKATLADGALIGSRVSILSGGHQHRFGADGKLTAFDLATVRPVQVGEETWVGEGAILLNDVGNRCIVAAGCVVSNPVPDGCVVGGNPARFIGKTLASSVAVRQEAEA
jgi:virginiamycin A acetyltransferase